MKLSDYLAEKKISGAAFARMIGVSRATSHRLIHGTRKKKDAELFKRIHEATQGLVQPNDFYLEEVEG